MKNVRLNGEKRQIMEMLVLVQACRPCERPYLSISYENKNSTRQAQIATYQRVNRIYQG